MKATLNAKALKAIDDAVVFSVQLEASADVVRAQVQGLDRDAVRDAVIQRFAWKAGIALTIKSTGRVVWPSDDPRTAKAKQACNRFVRLIVEGKSNQKAKDEMAVPSDILALAKKLVAACNKYEKAGIVLSAALDQAKAKAKAK